MKSDSLLEAQLGGVIYFIQTLKSFHWCNILEYIKEISHLKAFPINPLSLSGNEVFEGFINVLQRK